MRSVVTCDPQNPIIKWKPDMVLFSFPDGTTELVDVNAPDRHEFITLGGRHLEDLTATEAVVAFTSETLICRRCGRLSSPPLWYCGPAVCYTP